MARKLPWLSNTSKAPNGNQRNDKRPLQSNKLFASDDDSNRDQADDARETRPRARFKVRAGASQTISPLVAATTAPASLTSPTARNPSSSPPPPPPETEFMKDGLAGDDIWVMVEDEFLATAKAFTAHLHHAEYQRLKGLARARAKQRSDDTKSGNNAAKDWADSMGATMARSIDGRVGLSVEARNGVRAEELREKQGTALNSVGAELQGWRRSDGEEGWEDDVWRSNPRLAGLMVKREHTTRLAGLVGTQLQTRCTARTVERARNDAVVSRCSTSDDNHDLDAPVRKQAAVSDSVVRHNGSSSRYIRPSEEKPSRRKERPLRSEAVPSSPPELPSSPPLAPSTAKSRWGSTGKPDEDVLDDTSWRSGFEQRMAKRKAEAAKREDKKQKSLRLDEIPTFLV